MAAKKNVAKPGDANQPNPGANKSQNLENKITGEVDYQVNRDSLNHDGEEFGLGDAIAIDDPKQRKALVDLKAIVPTGFALLVGGVKPDGTVVELRDMELKELQQLGVDLGINRADVLNKEALIEAISAVELELIGEE